VRTPPLRPGRVSDALQPVEGARQRAAVAPQRPEDGPRAAEGSRGVRSLATAPPDAVEAHAQGFGAPPAAAQLAGEPSHSPDRPSERERAGRRAAGSGSGRAVAVLGKNTSNVSPRWVPARVNRWELRSSLRPIQAARQAKCGHCRVAALVGIVIRDGRAGFSGLMRCSSVWSCPVCAATIRSTRAGEVRQAYTWHRSNGGEVLMLTLTVRHGIGDDLKAVRRGVANAWRRVQAGNRWILIRRQCGLVGTVRALEVTHGKNGWHPHLHVLMLVRGGMSDSAKKLLRDRLSVRWQRAVERSLGPGFVPNDAIGCNLTVAHEAEYITKLGLELSDIGKKSARKGNRTPWEIAADFHTQPTKRDKAIWMAFSAGMKGARMLTWSNGLRDAAGLNAELSDEEIVAQEEAREGDVLCTMDGDTWDRVRHVSPWRLLSAAEYGGVEAVQYELNLLLRAPP